MTDHPNKKFICSRCEQECDHLVTLSGYGTGPTKPLCGKCFNKMRKEIPRLARAKRNAKRG